MFRVNKAGVIDMVIGNGAYGISGDGGPATSSNVALGGPTALASDNSNNLYIADDYANRIRKVDAASGIISTIAGSGPIPQESLFNPNSLAIAGNGDVYVCESGHHRVRKVDAATGIITTVAGKGDAGDSGTYTGDGGLATLANLHPNAIALDAAGNLIIADGSDRICKVTKTTGINTTIAGNGGFGLTGDNGPALNAEIGYPVSIQFDRPGNLYFSSADHNSIRKITPDGIITTFARDGATPTYSGDGGLARQATLPGRGLLSIDGDSNILYSLFLSNEDHEVIRIDGLTTIVTTVVGTTAALADNIPAHNAQFYWPTGMAVDLAGNVYVADTWSSSVRKISANTGLITTVAGNGGVSSGDGELAISARSSSLPVPERQLGCRSGNRRRGAGVAV